MTRKKLIEVALPLEAINKEAAREKSIRHGHPSTLHLWWARRPLAACRAVLFASLVDDPSAWPERFPSEEEQEAERQRLFRILEQAVRWEAVNGKDKDAVRALVQARAEIARSVAWGRGDEPPSGDEAVREYLSEHAPPVLDPFCGGGSIPLEAQRLGLRAYASDLNPVAVLITKALIEIPPRFADRPPVHPDQEEEVLKKEWRGAQGLAEDVRWYGEWMRQQAKERIGEFYPKVRVSGEMLAGREDLQKQGIEAGDELTVIAWLWARTVRCPNPACGAKMPLVRSFALSKKKGKRASVQPSINANEVEYRVRAGAGTVASGTVNRRGARCLLCESSVEFEHVRSEAEAGRMGADLMAVVAEGSKGRIYLQPNEPHVEAAAKAIPEDAPETDLPAKALGFRVQRYGMTKHRDLFTPRQLLALTTFSDLVGDAIEQVEADARAAGQVKDSTPLAEGGDGARAYAEAVGTYLAMGVSRMSDICNALCRWESSKTQVRNLFGRQAIPMVWDFAEPNVFSDSAGDYGVSLGNLIKALRLTPASTGGSSRQLDATSAVNGVDSPVVSTDPPYYDNIGYADLSDFFYVWLRRSLGDIWPDLFSTLLTPKAEELVATPYRFDGDKTAAERFFEAGLEKAFNLFRREQSPQVPITLFYAFKQAEDRGEDGIASTGWETMLSGLLEQGFQITGTWPARTELVNRPVASGTAALASSIVLACRPRSQDAGLASRREFLAALEEELPEALRLLQHGSIAPVDLAQAAIGPGMAVFSRYAKVVEADGEAMTVRTALALINRVLDQVLEEQEGEFDRDTRFAVAWFEEYGLEPAEYGRAETLATAKDTSVDGVVRAGFLESRRGKVRLLTGDELDPDWDPQEDDRLTVWEITHYLIRRLGEGGEDAAATLLAHVGGDLGERARDLAYRLFGICERRDRPQDAIAYNTLVSAWPEISRLAGKRAAEVRGSQGELFGQ